MKRFEKTQDSLRSVRVIFGHFRKFFDKSS